MDEDSEAQKDIARAKNHIMGLSGDERWNFFLDVFFEGDHQFRQGVHAELDDLWKKIDELTELYNEVARRVNVLTIGTRTPDARAFRKHLNQGYAMLKRLEEDENGKPAAPPAGI
jgi:hypothetical protein